MEITIWDTSDVFGNVRSLGAARLMISIDAEDFY